MSSPVAGATIESDLLDVFKGVGLSLAQIRSLRNAVSEVQKRKSRQNTELHQVYIKNENAVKFNAVDPNKAVIPRAQIKLMETIGEGTFSVVKRALWYHPCGSKLDVAVKILREVSESIMEDLQVEASHLLKLQHSNLIRLYGVVQQPAMMVFELCEGGELLTRLRDTTKPVLLVTTLLDYCLQVVKALTFLESKQYVHRDVAARNILLTKDEKIVKLCDFGLMRGLKENERTYIMHSQNRVPFSWCPPESLRHRQFSHASDVWAFGVTAWEIFSFGEDPWIGCRAIDVLKRLDAGERLEKPRYCSQQIYDLISLCWNINPDLRPKFSMLRTLLLGAEFNIAEVRDATHSEQSDNMLQVIPKDKIIIIENSGLLWYGQNERTRKFGNLLRSAIFVHSKSMVNNSQRDVCPAVGNSNISLPIRGSFIHAAHGDVFGGESWGTPEKIDDIYLKNPVVGNPLDFTMNGVSVITRSVVGSSVASLPTSNVICHPSTSKEIRDPFKVDWEEAFDTASFAEYFSPNKIEVPKHGSKVNDYPIIPRPRPSSTPAVTSSSSGDKQQHYGDDTSSLKRPRTSAKLDNQVQPNINCIANVLKELSSEIANRRKPGSVGHPPHQEPRVLFSETGLTLAGNDPFEVSDSVKKAVHNERYNHILEKKAVESKALHAGSAVPIPTALVGNTASSSSVSNDDQTYPEHVSSRQSELHGTKLHSKTNCSGKEQQTFFPSIVRNTNQSNFAQSYNAVGHFNEPQQPEPPQEKATSNKPSDGGDAQLIPSYESNAELKSRTVLSNPLLDESRRSRVEDEISKALPPPSELFFGKFGSVTNHSPTVAESKNEASGTSVQKMSNINPCPPELSLDGVLEPIRIPFNIPPQPPVGSANVDSAVPSSTQQFLEDLSSNGSGNVNSIMAQPVVHRQLPLFSLSNNPIITSSMARHRFGVVMPDLPFNYYGTGAPSYSNSEQYGNGVLPPRLGPCVPFQIGEGEDLLEVLDPLSTYSRMGRTNITSTSTQESPLTRAEQMEILYMDAPFADRSRCDQMVAKCKGNIETALQELKIEHLVETQIASSRECAKEALTARAWNLNAAAELLLTYPSSNSFVGYR